MSNAELNVKNLKNNAIKLLKNYELIEKIGEGNYGVVYKALQKSTQQNVAIKILKIPKNLNEQNRKKQLARFERETQLCAEINHPNIVKLIDKGLTNSQEPFAVFEYLSGENLKDYLKNIQNKSLEEVSELMLQVLDAIVSAHNKGIVHRDLKPQNIMIIHTGSKFHAKVLDFGIGEYAHGSNFFTNSNSTSAQDIVGTPAYCAPEQLRGEPPTIKSDLYAWGLILMECITGETVMKGTNIGGILQQQLSANNVEMPDYIEQHPVGDILKKVLQKKPSLRVGNAAEIYTAFSKINLSNIVVPLPFPAINNTQNNDTQRTIVNPNKWIDSESEKRQITVLCIKLSIASENESELDIETFDTLQEDQINLCHDVMIKYGGFISGTLADNTMVYFGYPEINDNDARVAGRAALELINKVSKRSALLTKTHRIKLNISISMNSGLVLAKNNQIPQGLVPNNAFNLLYKTAPNQILVSKSVKKLLAPFLEFKRAKNGFLLTGELQSESLLFLNPRSTHKKMLGRKKELKSILNDFKDQKTKNQGYIINGQAGIGKSKLIYGVKQQLLKYNTIVKHCQCLPEHQNNTLYPIFEMLKRHFEIHENTEHQETIVKLKDILTQVKCDVKKSLPIICSWLSIPLDGYQIPEASPQEQKRLLFNILEKIICSIGIQKKFLFIIEDLHWGDPTSKLFIEFLLEKNNPQNYLILLSTRTNFVKQNLDPTSLKEIKLLPLKQSDIKLLIENVLGQSVSNELAIFINQQTDGVAFYVEEFTQMLLNKQLIAFENNVFQLVKKTENAEIPETLVGLLQTRLKSLGIALETAQLAASIGREFSYELLLQSSSKDEAMIQVDLNQLVESNIIYQRLNVDGSKYIFRHALMRDAAEEGMTNSLKKETHKRIGFILNGYADTRRKEYIQRIAHHYHKAELFNQAVNLYSEAADLQMLKKLGHLESINLTDKALSIIGHLKKHSQLEYDYIQEANLRVHKAAVLTNKFGWQHPEIIENYTIVDHLLKNTQKNSKLEFALAKGKWIFECTKGNVTEMYVLTKKMKKAAEALDDSNYLAQMYDCLSQTQFFDSDFEGCIVSCEKCYKVYNKKTGMQKLVLDGLDPFIVCRSFDALAKLFLGKIDEAIHTMEQVIIEVNSYSWSNLTMGIFAQYSRLYLYLCSFLPNCKFEKELLDKLNSNIKLFKQKGTFPYWENAIYLNTISVQTLLNEEGAFQKYQIARKKWAPKTSAKAYYDLIEVTNCLKNKKFKESLKIVESSIDFADTHKVTYGLAYAYCFKAIALQGLGQIQMAEENFNTALQIAQRQKAKWIELFVINSFKKFLKDENKNNDFYKFSAIKINTKYPLTLTAI